MADRKRMSDDDLIVILRKEEAASRSFQDGTLSPIRTEAQNYYDRMPYGDEQEGSSSVVTSEFQDVVEGLMPEFVPPGEKGEPRIYVPKPSDGCGFIEVSHPSKRIFGKFVSAPQYCEWLWNRVSFTRDYWPYFKRPSIMETDLNPDMPFGFEVEKQFTQVMDMLEATRARFMDNFNDRKFASRFTRERLMPAMARS